VNRVVVDVLEGLGVRLLADIRIEDGVVAQLVDALSEDVIPTHDDVVEIIRRSASGADE